MRPLHSFSLLAWPIAERGSTYWASCLRIRSSRRSFSQQKNSPQSSAWLWLLIASMSDSDAIPFISGGYHPQRTWQKHNYPSCQYTTRWSEIPVVNTREDEGRRDGPFLKEQETKAREKSDANSAEKPRAELPESLAAW